MAPLDGSLTERRSDVRAVLVGVVTWRTIVADGENLRAQGAVEVLKSTSLVGAVHGSTSDGGGVFPDNLRKVTPALEVGSAWAGLTVETVERVDFTVVPSIGNDRRNVGGSATGGNVLTISSTSGSNVVLPDTGACNGSGDGSEFVVPGKIWGRVVGTVEVVVKNSCLLVGASGS